MTVESANFWAAEAAVNKEKGAGGGEGAIDRFWCFLLFKRRERSNSKVFGCCAKNGEFVSCGWNFVATEQIFAKKLKKWALDF